MNKPNLKGLKQDQLSYIEYLETELSSYQNDGARRLLSELSGIAGDFANDISNIRNGLGNGIYINDDKDDKILDKVVKIIDKMDKFKLLAQLTEKEEEVKPEKKKILRPEDLLNANR